MTTPSPDDLFTLGLGLHAPWRVMSSQFDVQAGLQLTLSCDASAPVACPLCGQACPRYDAVEREWQHLSFWQHATHLRARVPRVQCAEHGVRMVAVPWARPEVGFTLLFEAFAMQLVASMPVAAAARVLGITDQRLWRIVRHRVEAARQSLDLSGVRQIGIDETSAHAKTPFITVVVDMERRRAVFVTPGKGSDTLQAFAEDLKQHGGDPTRITEASCDMSAAFIAGIRDHLPAANITFDKFHLTKLVIEAMDEVRRDEADSSRFAPLLAGSIVALRRNPENQRPDEALHAQIIALPQLHLKTGKAYRLKLAFQDAFSQAGQTGVAAMARWCAWAQRCRLAPFRRVARTIRKHWDGVVRYFTTGLTNAILEGINSLIQSAKARARGFRTTRNLIAIVYVVVGKLPLAQVG